MARNPLVVSELYFIYCPNEKVYFIHKAKKIYQKYILSIIYI